MNKVDDPIGNLASRYASKKEIYTWCGIALVAVNPYTDIDIYGKQVIETYHIAPDLLQLNPHIYAIAENAYSNLERNQSIIVSGESGAGKTVSAKLVMSYFAYIASSKSELKIEDRVLASNPIMEAIGNASTVRNENSSRFGKYIQIFFDQQRKISGGCMRTYLLEKSRVTTQQVGERNFHIFYQLLKYANDNPDETKHLKLSCSNFVYINNGHLNSTSKPHSEVGDLMKFQSAFKTLGIGEDKCDAVYRIVAGILHGGNIKFAEKVEDCNESFIDDSCQSNLMACCELLGFDKTEILSKLTTRKYRICGDEIVSPLSTSGAKHGRDAMFKALYNCLFSYLVKLINISLSSNQAVKSCSPKKVAKEPISVSNEPPFIGVLDIYGFENFNTNSFEQFCINYANEVLQQQFNQHVFKLEQDEYTREGIDWTFIEFKDNQPVIDLIESKPIGILQLLDEECKMPKGTDETWCKKLHEQLKRPNQNETTNQALPIFSKPKFNSNLSFTISHYAEVVTYTADTFLEKNRDTLWEHQCDLLKNSTFLQQVFASDAVFQNLGNTMNNTERGKTLARGSTSVAAQFKISLKSLMKTLNLTEPHYIRCIKPNDEKKAFVFDTKRAAEQLRACGVYETIRISTNGFPTRWLYKDFARRFAIIIVGSDLSVIAKSKSLSSSTNNNNDSPPPIGQSSRHICQAICEYVYIHQAYDYLLYDSEKSYLNELKSKSRAVNNSSSPIYQFGKTKVFFRSRQAGFLERIRSHKLRQFAITIQRHIRGWLARQYCQRLRQESLKRLEDNMMKRRMEAACLIQRNWRKASARRKYEDQLRIIEDEKEPEPESDINTTLSNVCQVLIKCLYARIQPSIIDAILEFDGLNYGHYPHDLSSESKQSIDSGTVVSQENAMELLQNELDAIYDLIVNSDITQDITLAIFKQLFNLICTQSLNQLLWRQDLCNWSKALTIRFNLSLLEQWCREKQLYCWQDIVEQMDPITQATKLLQTRKNTENIATINEMCSKLMPSQIIKILNMYSSSYEEQVDSQFTKELEKYLRENRQMM